MFCADASPRLCLYVRPALTARPKPVSEDSNDLIEISLGKLGGKPVFRGTRIPIAYLSQYLNHDYTVEDFIQQHDIDPELVRAVYRRYIADADEEENQAPD